jgi:serine/threonine protein kinase
VIQFFRSDSLLFLIFEHCPSGSLRDLVDAGPRFSDQQLRRTCGNLAAELSDFHLHGIMHRDIKPSNLLLDKHRRVKLADFGLATQRPDCVANCPSK